jgi:hypothetical protein
MPQQCELFYGTVAQNLRLVHPAATDAEVNWAVEMAGLAEDIKAAFAFLRGQRTDGFDDGGNGGGQPPERAEKAKENQEVDQIAGDVARFVDTLDDRILDRARGGGRDRHPR